MHPLHSLIHALSVVHRWHYRPAVPWCELKPRDGVHVCASAACDTMFVAGREYAMPLLDQARQHRDCASGAVSLWRARGGRSVLTGCCTDAERLLWWTVRTYGMPSFLGSLPTPGSQHHVLRIAENACDISFDVRFERWPYAMKVVSAGLPLTTAIGLRRVFGGKAMCTLRNGRCSRPLPDGKNETSVEDRQTFTSACREALGLRWRAGG